MALDLSLDKGNYDWRTLEKYSKDTGLVVEDVKKCYDFAKKAHEGQKRVSGEDFFCHPFWVAKVVTQLGIGHKAVFAALLHDVIEDTNTTLDDVAKEFGDEVGLLVNGLTEVRNRTRGIEVHQTSIEVFRKFLFSSVDDVRVLIVRIVDKLHNGLTIESLPKERQIKYAKRVFGIYSPIAEYVGLHYFKRLLEDIAFKILYPEEALKLEVELRGRKRYELKALAMVKADLGRMLRANKINDCLVEGRIKSLYSTYLKAKRKGYDRVKDRVGIRVIAEKVEDCYTILGLLHSRYKYLADEFDDYISAPKPNGYRSIQTTLIWKDRLTVEVQIRTKEMHEFNEFGPASHIVYKLNKGTYENMSLSWVKDLIKWQIKDDEVKNYQINVLKNYIYVFTPKGDTIQLPAGSTALDFAYRIHTDIGDRCSGAIVNKKMKKIDTVLETGDMIEILLNKKPNVNKNWLNLVKTQWAKEHIRKVVYAKELLS